MRITAKVDYAVRAVAELAAVEGMLLVLYGVAELTGGDRELRKLRDP